MSNWLEKQMNEAHEEFSDWPKWKRDAMMREIESVEPCLHDQCHECLGTGRKADGSQCVHMISCQCP